MKNERLLKYQKTFYRDNQRKKFKKNIFLLIVLLLLLISLFAKLSREQKKEIEFQEEPEAIQPLPAEPAIISAIAKRGYPVMNRIEDGRFVEYFKEHKIIYTVDPKLQKKVLKIFSKYNVPYGSFIAIDPSTGRLLAYSSFSQSKNSVPLFNLKSTYPAASLFKLIVAAGVIEEGLLARTSIIGYRGNPYKLNRRKIKNSPKYDRNISTLENALGKSNNVVFGKIGANILGQQKLIAYTDRFLFNTQISFDFPVEPSRSEIPAEKYPLARVSAGFNGVTISPLHSALITAAIANDGVMQKPFIIDSILDKEGKIVYKATPSILTRVLSKRTAGEVRKMMLKTTKNGTSSKTFRRYAGKLIKRVTIGGKTGSLYARNPRGFYDWYVGFAPEKNSEIALSALIINGYKWRIKGTYVGQAALKTFFKNRKKAL